MILGPYRNPPYRSPTPSGSSMSPPPHGPHQNRNPSPKRKRSDTVESSTTGPSQTLGIETSRISDDKAPDSPRSKVAERLKNLEIRQSRPQPSHLGNQDVAPSGSQSPRKRLKRDVNLRDLRGEMQARQLKRGPVDEMQTPQHARPLEIPDSVGESTMIISEIGETPDAYDRATDAMAMQSDNGIHDLNETVDLVMAEGHSPRPRRLPSPSPSKKRMLSPPPSSTLPVSSQASASDPFLSPNTSFTSSNGSFSSDEKDINFDWSTSLTWQDSEITGHEISAPDDDGEGINGIGFRPTAAIAYARSQKRKQQVNDWKTREAKEARQRRMERRRGAGRGESVDLSSDPAGSQGESEGRRMVRFATPGAA